MPYSEKQKDAACAELGRRKKGEAKQGEGPERPFRDADLKTLHDFCSGKVEQKKEPS